MFAKPPLSILNSTTLRFAREHLGDVRKALLEGLYDDESPLSCLGGIYHVKKDIWEMVVRDRYNV